MAVRRELLDLPESGIVPPVIRYGSGPVPPYVAGRDTPRRPFRARVVTALVCLSLLVTLAADDSPAVLPFERADESPSVGPFEGSWQYLPQTRGARLPYALHLELRLTGPPGSERARLFVATEDGYCHGYALEAKRAGDDSLVLTANEITKSYSNGDKEPVLTPCAWPEILTLRAEGPSLSVQGPAGYLPLARATDGARSIPDEFLGVWRSGDTLRVTIANAGADGPAAEWAETIKGEQCTWRAAYLGNRAGEIATGPGMLEPSSDKSCTADRRAYIYRFTDASHRILERRRTDGSEPVRFTLGS